MSNKSFNGSNDEKILTWIVRGILALIMFLFVLLGFIIKPQGSGSLIDVSNLWDAMHPASFINVVGVVCWLLCVLYVSGFWKKWIPEVVTMGAKWNYTALAIGILSVILMFA
jgi:hypothetical protein